VLDCDDQADGYVGPDSRVIDLKEWFVCDR